MVTVPAPVELRADAVDGKLVVAVLAVLSLLLPVYGIGGLLEPVKWPLLLLRPAAPAAAGQVVNRIEHWQARLADGWQQGFAGTPALARLGRGLGSEFMPELFEGDLMYMPTTYPGLSIGKAQDAQQAMMEKVKELTEKVEKLQEEIRYYLMRIPNVLHESVPVGKDETENKTVRKWGEIKKFDFKLKNENAALLV